MNGDLTVCAHHCGGTSFILLADEAKQILVACNSCGGVFPLSDFAEAVSPRLSPEDANG